MTLKNIDSNAPKNMQPWISVLEKTIIELTGRIAALESQITTQSGR